MKYFTSVLVALSLIFPVFAQQAPIKKAKVLKLLLRDEIKPTTQRYVKLGLQYARDIKADYILIDMDTYGGTLNDADAIRSQLLEFEKPVFVWINKNAASAGALIALACDRIFMARGASIGAATVVNSEDGSQAPDKYQSYMRSIMRATAEANGRNPHIAEAMVDDEIVVEGLNQPGQVITFTSSEAVKHGYADGKAESYQELLNKNNLYDYEILSYELPLIEEAISFFLNPLISSLLILLMVGGLIVEMKSPGLMLGIGVAILAALLYFVPYYLNGLADNWEIALFALGITLLAIEIFLIPGFGITGIAGIALTSFALGLVMLDNHWFDFSRVSHETLMRALITVVLSLVCSIGLIIFVAENFTKTRFYKRAALHGVFDAKSGYTVGGDLKQVVGQRAVTYTVLRPGGKILINDKLYDASTRGIFLEKGVEVEVIAQEGNSLKVKQI